MTSAACRAVMMALRERAVKVMAALDRRVPSLDDFVGQSWTAWADWAGVTAADGPDPNDCSKNGNKAAEAMSLSKEDMSIFGLYPGHDDFYLVVCSHCGQVVKPQAFEKHCERRHGSLAKVYARLRSPTAQQRPQHAHCPPHGSSPAPGPVPSPVLGPVRAAPTSPSTPPHFKASKNSKDAVRHTDSLLFKQPHSLDPPMSSPPPSLRDPPWPHGGAPPVRSSPPLQPSPRKESSVAGVVPAHRVPRPYNKVASKRECDLDKHCGVLDRDRKKICTRLLTCNIHSIHQRRKVTGRSKNFDQLVAELKTKVREKGLSSADGASSAGHCQGPAAAKEQSGAHSFRRPLASLPAFSRSPAGGESSAEEETQQADEGGLRAPSPLVHGRISSDDSDSEVHEEAPDFQTSAAHPRPLAVCSFGSHSLGRGIYTFDRRLHHLRSALSSMLEQHISAHLWKKIPQAADLQSPPPSLKTPTASPPRSVFVPSSFSSSSPSSTTFPSSLHSKMRSSGASFRSSLKASSPSSSSRTTARAPPPSVAVPWEGSGGSSREGGQTRNPVGRPSKQMLKLREEAAAAAALRKRKAPSQDGEHSDRNCLLLQERGRPPPTSSSTSPCSSSKATHHSSLPHRQPNGTLSPSSKSRLPPPPPLPPPPESPVWTYRRAPSDPYSAPNNSHSRVTVGDSGLHAGQAGGGRSFDQQNRLMKKRKAVVGGAKERSPSSKASMHRLPTSSSSSSSSTSPSPRSSFYPWKDSKGGGVSLDKKLGTHKPKLHH